VLPQQDHHLHKGRSTGNASLYGEKCFPIPPGLQAIPIQEKEKHHPRQACSSRRMVYQ